jgi:hypothetical protein
MLHEKSTMLTEAIFSDDRQQRYLLRKEWDTDKPKATIIMTNPSTADINRLDYTTLYILNNLIKLDFGGVDIVNMTARTTTKLNVKEGLDNEADEVNTQYILTSAQQSDHVIIAWGKLGENNKKVRAVQEGILEELRPFTDKLYLIANEAGDAGHHPLSPSIRFTWVLTKFELSTPPAEPPKSEEPKKRGRKKSEPADTAIQTVTTDQHEMTKPDMI